MSLNFNDEASDIDAIGSPESDTVYGALISEEIERTARDTRLDFFDFDKVTVPCTDKNDRAPNLNDEASDTDAISSPKSDIVYGALMSEQIERAARDVRLDFFDFDKGVVLCTDKNDRAPNLNNEANPTAVIEIQEADVMLEEPMSEHIDRAAQEAGLDVCDYDNELAAGSDKSDKGNSGSEDDGDTGGNEDGLNVFEDMESVHSDDMFGGFDQTKEEQIESAVRQQRSKRHFDDENTNAAMQAQAVIEQQEREEGARAKRRKGAEIEEAAAAAALPSDRTPHSEQFKVVLEPIRDSVQNSDAAEKIEKSGQEQKQEQETVQPSQQADVAEKIETSDQEQMQQQDPILPSQGKWRTAASSESSISDQKQKQGQIAMQPSQQADVGTMQVKKARRTRPKIEQRRYLEQIKAEWEDMLAWTESTTVQWTRHRNNGKC
jgi:hypothetical protein